MKKVIMVLFGLSLLAGYPQHTVYCAYAWGALLLVLLLAERADRPRALRAAAGSER